LLMVIDLVPMLERSLAVAALPLDVVENQPIDWGDEMDNLTMAIRVAIPALHVDLSLSVPVNVETGRGSFVQQLVSRVSATYPCTKLLNGDQATAAQAFDKKCQKLARLQKERHEFYEQVASKFERMAQTIQQLKRDYYREIDHLREQIRALKRDPLACLDSVVFFDPEMYKLPSWEDMLEHMDNNRMRREALKESGGVNIKHVPVYMLCQSCRGKFQAQADESANKLCCTDASTQTEDALKLEEGSKVTCLNAVQSGFDAVRFRNEGSTTIFESDRDCAFILQRSLDSNSLDFVCDEDRDADRSSMDARSKVSSFAAASSVHDEHAFSILSPRSVWIAKNTIVSHRPPINGIGSITFDIEHPLASSSCISEDTKTQTDIIDNMDFACPSYASDASLQPSEDEFKGQTRNLSRSSSESSQEVASLSGSIPIDVWMRRRSLKDDRLMAPNAAMRSADAIGAPICMERLPSGSNSRNIRRGRTRRRLGVTSMPDASGACLDGLALDNDDSDDEEHAGKHTRKSLSLHQEDESRRRCVKENKENEKPSDEHPHTSYHQVPIVSMSPEFSPPDSKLIWRRKVRPSTVTICRSSQHEGIQPSESISSVPDTVNLRLPRLPSTGSPDASPGLSARSWVSSGRSTGRPRRNSVPIGTFACIDL